MSFNEPDFAGEGSLTLEIQTVGLGWFGSSLPQKNAKDVKGAKASAAVYSQIETEKLNGFEPHDKLTAVNRGLPEVQTVAAIEGVLII